jgi:hypothetical protein
VAELDGLLEGELGAEQHRLRAAGGVGAVLHAAADHHADEPVEPGRHAAQHVGEDQGGVVQLLHGGVGELAPDPVELAPLRVLVVLPGGVPEGVDGVTELRHASTVLSAGPLHDRLGTVRRRGRVG